MAPHLTPSPPGLGVSPVIFDRSWKATVLPTHPLRRGWNTVTFRLPPATARVKVLGLQVANPTDWEEGLALDRVTIARPRHTFEDGGLAGWHVRLGRASLADTRSTAYAGRRALRIKPRAGGPFAVSTTRVHALRPGWNEVDLVLPTSLTGTREIGLRFNPATRWHGRFLIDEVSW